MNIEVSFSQQSKTDSLLTLLKTEKEDTAKINILNLLSEEFFRLGKYDSSFKHAEQSLNMLQGLPSVSESYLKTAFLRAYNNCGNACREKGEYDKSLEYYLQALENAEKSVQLHDSAVTRLLAITHSNIAGTHYFKGNFDKSLSSYFSALRLFEKINDRKKIASTYNNIGLLYEKNKTFDEAIDFNMKAASIHEETGNKRGLSASYQNIGSLLNEKKDYDSAMTYFFKAMNINKETDNKIWLAFNLQGIGNSLEEKKDFEKALYYHSQSLEIRKEINETRGIAVSCGNIGSVYFKTGNFSEAKKNLLICLTMAKEITAKPEILQSYILLSQCDSATAASPLTPLHKRGEYWKSAYEYHKLYSQYKDSVFNEESSKQIAEMQTKYESEKKELQIENLNKDNEIKSSEIKKQNIQKIAFASGFALMLILAFVIFRGYNQKKKANEIITAQKTEVEKQKVIVEEKNKSLEVAYKHIEEKNTEILDSIRYAKRIQDAILPPQKLVKSYLENSFILYKPKDIVAGDFYWFSPSPHPHNTAGTVGTSPALPVREGETTHKASVDETPLLTGGDGGGLLFACCDCTGHGVPGAFVSIVAHNALNRAVKEFGLTQPAKILDKVNELVEEGFSKSENDIKDGMDIALVKLVISNQSSVIGKKGNEAIPPITDYRLPTTILEYAGAGNSLYHIRENNLIEYKADKQPIGKFSNRKPFTNHEIQLQEGDAIYIFTDGYADQFGGSRGKKFKYSQFEKLLVSIQDRTMEEQREILNKTIDEWRGEVQQIDDICVIGVRI